MKRMEVFQGWGEWYLSLSYTRSQREMSDERDLFAAKDLGWGVCWGVVWSLNVGTATRGASLGGDAPNSICGVAWV